MGVSTMAGMVRLRYGARGERGFLLPTCAVTLLGRGASNQIVLVDPDVSIVHCLLAPRRSGEGFTLIDARSRTGTLVNGAPLTERVVDIGDHLTVGPFELELTEAGNGEGGPMPGRAGTGRPACWHLVARGGRARAEALVPGSATLVGRAALADIHLDTRDVGDFHALFVLDPGDQRRVPFLIDLRSGGGTLVNGRPVHRKHVFGGDIVTLGQSDFEVRATEPLQGRAKRVTDLVLAAQRLAQVPGEPDALPQTLCDPRSGPPEEGLESVLYELSMAPTPIEPQPALGQAGSAELWEGSPASAPDWPGPDEDEDPGPLPPLRGPGAHQNPLTLPLPVSRVGLPTAVWRLP